MNHAERANYLRDIADEFLHDDLGEEAVINRDEDEALLEKVARLLLHVPLVSRLPASPVNPEDDGQVLGSGRCVTVEDVAGVYVFDIG
jgi:hypothetical protein